MSLEQSRERGTLAALLPPTMNFTPSPRWFYRLTPKPAPADFALTIPGGSTADGVRVQQLRFASSPFQEFKFISRGGPFYSIKARHSGKVLDIAGGSGGRGAELAQQGDNGGSSQQFVFVPAGGSDFFIRARHSNKYLAVKDGSTQSGALVIQDDPNGQPRFKFTIAGTTQDLDAGYEPIAGGVEIGGSSLQIRDLVIAGAGLVPEVGGAIKGLLTFLWPASSPRLWTELAEYVQAVVTDLIAQERSIQLEQKLQGLFNVASSYVKASGTQRREFFSSLLALLNEADPMFCDLRSPEKHLWHLVAFATLRIVALRDQYDHFKEIYGEDDARRAEHLKDIQEAIKKYAGAAKLGRDTALRRRLDKIKISRTYQEFNRGRWNRWRIWDEFDGWSREKVFFAAGPNDEASGKREATRVFDDRKKEIGDQIFTRLEAIFAPLYAWNALDPANRSQPHPVTYDAVSATFARDIPFGIPFLEPLMAAGRLSGITVYANNVVRGLQFAYGGRTGFLFGKAEGNRYHLDLAADEAVVHAYGRTNPNDGTFTGLWFVTTQGRLGGGGTYVGPDFAAESSGGGELVAVTGTFLNELESVRFHWRHAQSVVGTPFPDKLAVDVPPALKASAPIDDGAGEKIILLE